MSSVYPIIHLIIDLAVMGILFLILDTAAVGNDIAQETNRRINEHNGQDLKRELDREFEALHEKATL